MDEWFAGPSVLAVNILLLKVSKSSCRLGMTIMDVTCAFLYSHIRRRCIRTGGDGEAGDEGRLMKAMYGTREAPQIWTWSGRI